ncbi:GDP-L-fucose synthase family protein [Anatilimnocola floriformis]|uniref:GDP-L-fucose synthase family protein n=1 Tax=Anatilimnocola floriformis TaxID=2948575 RepID=UPI0020C28EFD|nr:GDP-L-fucose synthase [Anatilimnocola floriformis]
MNWETTSVVVTGGAGFLGSFVVEGLRSRGCTNITVPRSASCDLRNRAEIRSLLEASRPDLIFHLAATVGGIGANQVNPGRFFFDNAVMGIELIEQSRQLGIPKVVIVGTVCAYPKFTAVPFREDDLWDGYPEETNAPYGLAKKMLLVQAQAYRQQYGFNSIYLLPANLYGPRDNFEPASSHVIPALIRKCVEAKQQGQPAITLWGDGSATREFLYASDAAEGLLQAAEKYDGAEPVNLGTGNEISIRELAKLIAAEVGYLGSVEWDTSKPNGQPRRALDHQRAESLFGFRAATPLVVGLRQTVQWYLAQL